jgi:ABC-type Zn uptake system ZnuABC Zn-binding protein ZnuA
LDPKRAIQQGKTIRDGLIEADPTGKATYNANAAAYIVKLKQLNGEFTEKLHPFAGKTLITYHVFASGYPFLQSLFPPCPKKYLTDKMVSSSSDRLEMLSSLRKRYAPTNLNSR